MMKKLNEEQEKIIRMNILEQEARQFEQQLSILEQQIIETELLQVHLEDIKQAKAGQEILASLGKNIFIQAELKGREIFVDVGGKSVVKKSIDEAKELVEKETKKLVEVRKEMMNELQKIAEEMQAVSR